MNKKVILISVDGMRPDGFLTCGNHFTEEIMKAGSYTLDAKSVFPSVTLPCHMSIFHSVPPERHGITTNTYTPQVHPVDGLFEVIKAAGGRCAMFYNWEPLRDIARPGSLKFSNYIEAYEFESTDKFLTENALLYIGKNSPDFVFLYMVETDKKGGHKNGWMTDNYLTVLNAALDNVKRIFEAFGTEYTIIITADHGGHERSHGTEMPEDMTVPMFFIGKDFEAGKLFEGGSIMDIAPTIAEVMEIAKAADWEGKSLVNRRKL